MSEQVIVKCDGCGVELKRHKEPYSVVVSRTTGSISGDWKTSDPEKHACNEVCFRKVMIQLTPAVEMDGTISKGVYR